MKIKNLISQLETALETAKAILAEQTATGIKRYVHKDGWEDNSVSHVEVSGEKVTLVYKNGEKKDVSYWTVERTEYFEKEGIWIPIPESAAKAPVKVRRFKHRKGKNAFVEYVGKNIRRGTYIEERDGKYFLVLKNGYRMKSGWVKGQVESMVRQGFWIEVK